MDNNKNMDVGDWVYTPPPTIVRVRASRWYVPPTFIGVAGTILFHVLIVPSVYFGDWGSQTHPPAIPVFGATLKSKSDSGENLVLLTLPIVAPSSPAISLDFAMEKIAVREPEQEIADMPILALDDQQPDESKGSGSDGDQARLVGIYTGQIRARVERLWRRPRTVVDEPSESATGNSDDLFHCQVQIIQDERGFVQEVLLPRCNGSPDWQRSLVTAIQQASPLPAPPSASVFSRSIAVEFVGLPYVKGAPPDDYEDETRVARTAEDVSKSFATEFGEGRAQDSQSQKSVTGSRNSQQ
jgi:hypothetical protein